MLWAIPAAAIYGFRHAAVDDLGLKDHDIIAYSAPATPRLEAITANTTTPYITAFADLRKGPAVLEIPGGKGINQSGGWPFSRTPSGTCIITDIAVWETELLHGKKWSNAFCLLSLGGCCHGLHPLGEKVDEFGLDIQTHRGESARRANTDRIFGRAFPVAASRCRRTTR